MNDSSVLGIDAAWTSHNPSGVALITRTEGRWTSLRVGASFAEFCGTQLAGVLDALAVARNLLGGRRPDVVAVDMPLALGPIVGRRVADDEISRTFGRNWCSAHSPTVKRPGVVAEALRDAFISEGYVLVTNDSARPPFALLEVYPHPAIVRLMTLDKRLPYKVSRARRYWPNESRSERQSSLQREWRRLYSALSKHVDDIPAVVPADVDGVTGEMLKAAEDRLDALVCAWVGTEWLDERAEALGDANAAVWVPRTRS